jgi:hypothetical protein
MDNGELEFYRKLKEADEDQRLQLIAHAIEEASKKNPDLSELATKSDLKNDLKDLEIKLLKAINDQTKLFLAGIALLGLVFKLAEMYLPHK